MHSILVILFLYCQMLIHYLIAAKHENDLEELAKDETTSASTITPTTSTTTTTVEPLHHDIGKFCVAKPFLSLWRELLRTDT